MSGDHYPLSCSTTCEYRGRETGYYHYNNRSGGFRRYNRAWVTSRRSTRSSRINGHLGRSSRSSPSVCFGYPGSAINYQCRCVGNHPVCPGGFTKSTGVGGHFGGGTYIFYWPSDRGPRHSRPRVYKSLSVRSDIHIQSGNALSNIIFRKGPRRRSSIFRAPTIVVRGMAHRSICGRVTHCPCPLRVAGRHRIAYGNIRRCGPVTVRHGL